MCGEAGPTRGGLGSRDGCLLSSPLMDGLIFFANRVHVEAAHPFLVEQWAMKIVAKENERRRQDA